jgi:hypothetical protein
VAGFAEHVRPLSSFFPFSEPDVVLTTVVGPEVFVRTCVYESNGLPAALLFVSNLRYNRAIKVKPALEPGDLRAYSVDNVWFIRAIGPDGSL